MRIAHRPHKRRMLAGMLLLALAASPSRAGIEDALLPINDEPIRLAPFIVKERKTIDLREMLPGRWQYERNLLLVRVSCLLEFADERTFTLALHYRALLKDEWLVLHGFYRVTGHTLALNPIFKGGTALANRRLKSVYLNLDLPSPEHLLLTGGKRQAYTLKKTTAEFPAAARRLLAPALAQPSS